MNVITDIHSHIIPEVDDGSKSLEMSMDILRMSYESGVRRIILTPHFRLGMFETSGEVIRKQYETLRAAADKEFPELKLFLGCEFHASMEQEELLKNPRFFLAGSRYLLLEFSGGDTESFIRDRVRAAQMMGAKVIIAHVERIRAINEQSGKKAFGLSGLFSAGNIGFVEDLKRSGVLIQLNADAVLGYDGRAVKKLCQKLIQEDLVDFIASDVHDIDERPTRVGECAEYIRSRFGDERAKRLFTDNPNRILKAVSI